LNQLGENRKSLEILDDAVQYWNDYDIQMLYAYNCQKLGEWARAEKHLKLASNMCPNRFLPLFNLHEVYVNTQRNDDALNIAKHIIDKNVKIPSATIYSIKAQMKRYMEEDSRK
jgi:tetratricopeptide (TPR) repeat protein